MKKQPYEREEIERLLPYLASIGRELEERGTELEAIEGRIEDLSENPDRNELHALVAEAATHRRELRMARQELDRLGCSIVGTEPLTLRIPGRVGSARHSFVWQRGDPVLK